MLEVSSLTRFRVGLCSRRCYKDWLHSRGIAFGLESLCFLRDASSLCGRFGPVGMEDRTRALQCFFLQPKVERLRDASARAWLPPPQGSTRLSVQGGGGVWLGIMRMGYV